jgi:hypothetical protein
MKIHLPFTCLLSAGFLILGSACKKTAGEGGTSVIQGKVWVEEWDASFIRHDSLQDRAGMGEDVFIIYGNDVSYGDKKECSYDGRFEFKYLRPGSYTLYVYSKDPGPSGKKAVVKTVQIDSEKQTVDAGTFTIKD